MANAMLQIIWRRTQLCRQMVGCAVVLILLAYVSDLLTNHLSSMSENDMVDLLPGKGMIEDDCMLRSHCSVVHPEINITHILAEKFSPDSHHRVEYRLRNDDVISNVQFPKNNPLCKIMRQDWVRSWVVIKNVFDSYIADPQGITLATQLSLDRTKAFRETVRHWEGTISVAVYFKEEMAEEFMIAFKEMIGTRTNIFVHAVLQGREHFYPGNLLRNVASQALETQFAFLIDGDFVPNVLAEKKLNVHRWALEQRTVLVLPAYAFLTPEPGPYFRALDAKQQVVKMTGRPGAGVVPFDKYSYVHGHRRTNYTRWNTATDIYEIAYELGFEPYVLLFTRDIAYYPETFLGMMHDKSSFFILLKLMEFRFFVLPDVYVIHYAHQKPATSSREKDCDFYVFRSWRHQMFIVWGVDPLHWKSKN